MIKNTNNNAADTSGQIRGSKCRDRRTPFGDSNLPSTANVAVNKKGDGPVHGVAEAVKVGDYNELPWLHAGRRLVQQVRSLEYKKKTFPSKHMDSIRLIQRECKKIQYDMPSELRIHVLLEHEKQSSATTSDSKSRCKKTHTCLLYTSPSPRDA